MANTTISGLNPVSQAIKSMKVAVDRYDGQGLPVETNNLTLEQILELFEIIGNTPPTGTFLPWLTNTLPKGYLEAGSSFDMNLYPQLALVFPSGVIPKINGRVLKHAPEGRNAGEFEEDNVKSHGHTAVFKGDPHDHNYSAANGKTAFAGTYLGAYTSKSTFKTNKVTVTGSVEIGETGARENTVKSVFVRYMVRAR